MSSAKIKADPTNRFMSTRPQAANKRTENLNHLLNFTLPPRSQPLLQHVPRRSRKPNNVYYNPESRPKVNCSVRLLIFQCRIRERPVQVRDEADWGLHRPFRGS